MLSETAVNGLERLLGELCENARFLDSMNVLKGTDYESTWDAVVADVYAARILLSVAREGWA